MTIRIFPNQRNDLYIFIEHYKPKDLEEVLVKGRFLQCSFHDNEAPPEKHMHLYRKVMKTYDSLSDKVLLSKIGSRRLISNLDQADKEFTLEELYEE